MRPTLQQIQAIRAVALKAAGENARIRVFGSRLDDAARGSDLDLMLELSDPVANPALLAARISARFPGPCQGEKATC